ncbi:MAG: hypothetical protein A2W91_08830 [Bacteroidetes bacterium GWF2_38_335]|nr:MAG: hypothetical protein A2W91_08830 [Bacteroidetes bacterium GWF2_38_335]OFY80478.1 MAG: hypothetical protein A2281_08555 [Bacteroidetes bacterium RIFOXYA12_FULL_38_20]HBS85914.1 hypothetical protein [Bacteroidales bacterium]
MNPVIEQMLSRYRVDTVNDRQNAMHEVMQQVTLAALYRAGFFDKAAFYGGTCLRIFYNLPRFSEDMDFSLLEKNPNFSIEDYFQFIETEFKAMGREVEISKKEKSGDSKIESAFLKDNTDVYNIAFKTEKTVKIKIEVDKDPPLKFHTDYRLLLLPFSFNTRCFSTSSLFAGKMHAFLFRNWKTRVKGRDWYDMEWYVRNNHKLDLVHLNQRCLQTGHIKKEINFSEVKELLREKVLKTNMERVKDDVRPFIISQDELKIWSHDYFLQLVDRMIER